MLGYFFYLLTHKINNVVKNKSIQAGRARLASLRENGFYSITQLAEKSIHLTLKPEVFFEGKRIRFSLKGITDCNYIILVN